MTPKVKEEVRNHFGCKELEGAELEDQVKATILYCRSLKIEHFDILFINMYG